MGTKFMCDVQGCENTEGMPGVEAGRALYLLPPGWIRVIIPMSHDELREKMQQKLQAAARIKGGLLGGPSYKEHRTLIVCPDHPLPEFKAPSFDEFDDLGGYGVIMEP